MSSSVRVYNLFNQINSFLQKGEIVTGKDMLKNVFGLESDEDLYYLKPYILAEIESCALEMKRDNMGDEDLKPIIPPFIRYIQENIFNTFNMLKGNIDIDIDIHTHSIHSHAYQNIVKVQFPRKSLQLLTYNAKPKLPLSDDFQNEAIQIKKDIASLKEDLLKLNKSDDYIYNFILLNLDRADILLNNFDKIRPHYIYYNLASIMPPILTFPDYSNCKKTLKELHDNYVAFMNKYGSAYVSTASILGFANQGFSLLLEKI